MKEAQSHGTVESFDCGSDYTRLLTRQNYTELHTHANECVHN